MRHLNEIKRINECLDPDDDWAGSEVPIEDKPQPPRILEPPPMYRYVKETFNVPATWWDHFKITARGHAAIYWPDWAYSIVSSVLKNIKSTRIPITYEIHAAPKITGRRGAR